MLNIKLNLYDVLTSVIGITTDVVVLQVSNQNLLVEHSSKNLVKDDVPTNLWKLDVVCITVNENYPNKIVVYVDL